MHPLDPVGDYVLKGGVPGNQVFFVFGEEGGVVLGFPVDGRVERLGVASDTLSWLLIVCI
jgi:hypothetical protein